MEWCYLNFIIISCALFNFWDFSKVVLVIWPIKLPSPMTISFKRPSGYCAVYATAFALWKNSHYEYSHRMTFSSTSKNSASCYQSFTISSRFASQYLIRGRKLKKQTHTCWSIVITEKISDVTRSRYNFCRCVYTRLPPTYPQQNLYVRKINMRSCFLKVGFLLVNVKILRKQWHWYIFLRNW